MKDNYYDELFSNKILIAAPVRDRSEIFPLYLQKIYELDYDKKNISLFFLFNNCKDNVIDIYKDFIDKHKDEYNELSYRVLDLPLPPLNNRSSVRRKELYSNLAILRNRIIYFAIESDCDYLFSVDSDLLLPSVSLKRLLWHNKDCVAGLVKNSDICDAYNFLFYNKNTNSFYREEIHDNKDEYIINVGLTGACVLIKRYVFELCRYNYGNSGEDEGFAIDCLNNRIRQYVDIRLTIPHIYNIDSYMKNGSGII